MLDLTRTFDVLVVGGGNAGLYAAITAREAGCSVLLLEHALAPFGAATAGTIVKRHLLLRDKATASFASPFR